MPGHSPSKTGVNALMAGHPRLSEVTKQVVDGRDKPGHDGVGGTPRARGALRGYVLSHHLTHQWDDVAPIKLDAPHHLLMRQRARAVFHAEAAGAESLHRRGDLARDRFGRSDVERTALDLALEIRAAHRRPAALGADLVAHALVVGEQFFPR